MHGWTNWCAAGVLFLYFQAIVSIFSSTLKIEALEMMGGVSLTSHGRDYVFVLNGYGFLPFLIH